MKLFRKCGAHVREGAMKVKVISILEDNYMYLVIEEQSKQAIAVDPAVPHRVRHTCNNIVFILALFALIKE